MGSLSWRVYTIWRSVQMATNTDGAAVERAPQWLEHRCFGYTDNVTLKMQSVQCAFKIIFMFISFHKTFIRKMCVFYFSYILYTK